MAETVRRPAVQPPDHGVTDRSLDVHTVGNRLDQPTPFGKYTQTLTNPRVMQFALRLEF